MAIARIEVVTDESDSADPGVCVATLGTATVTGELIVVQVVEGSGTAGDPASVTDNLSQTYTKIDTTGGQYDGRAHSLWYKQNSASGVTSVTVTFDSGDTRGGVIVGHYTGVATASSLDQHSPNTSSAGTSPFTGNTVTTTQANELLIATDLCFYGSGTSMDVLASGGWTRRGQIQSSTDFDGGNGHAMAYMDQIVSSIQTNVAATGTVTGGTANSNYPIIATFEAAATGPDVTITGVRALVTVTANPGVLSISGSYIEPESDVPCLVCATTVGESVTTGSAYIAPPPPTGVPTAVVVIDVTNNPTNGTRAWTDITQYVRQVSLTRDGRSNETERTQTGVCSLLVDNRDGRFNRDNPDGAYYPAFKTTCWLQVRGVWDGVTYDRWTGVIEQVSQSWPADGKDAVAQITAASPLKILNLVPLGGNNFGTQVSGARVAGVVSIAQLTAGTIESGAASLPAYAPAIGDGAKALPHLQAIEADESGIVFTDPSGKIEFQDRHHRMRMVSGTAVTMASGVTLTSGGTAQSASGDYYLIMQSDGNFVEYTANGCPVWSTGSNSSGTNSGASITMQSDGNLVVYHSGTAIWASNTVGHTGAFLGLFDNGDLNIFSSTGTAVLYHVDGHNGQIGDQRNAIPYNDVQYDDDDQFLYNTVVRTPTGGADTVSNSDATSITAHFERVHQQTMLSDLSSDCLNSAEAFTLRYKEPALRVNSIRVIGANVAAGFGGAWPTILNANNGDAYELARHYPGAGTIQTRVFLERVSEQIVPGNRWDTTWLLSPGTVDSYMANRFWRVGNPIYGKVGSFAVGY